MFSSGREHEFISKSARGRELNPINRIERPKALYKKPFPKTFTTHFL